MRRVIPACAFAVIVAVAAGTETPASASGDLAVTATYTGKGKVDESHEILVFLFDHPVPTAESVPLAVSPISSNGGTATFANLSAETVYVVMVYDEKANYDGRSGPPPQGHPIGTYSKAGKPVPVKIAPGTKVKATFDDSRRWAQ
jgi:hypothetical protein